MLVKHIGLLQNIELSLMDRQLKQSIKNADKLAKSIDSQTVRVKTVEIRNCKGLEQVLREGSE